MNPRFATAALLLLAASAVAATPGIDVPPEPGPPRAVAVPPMTQQRLPNGVTVVVAPRSEVPLVSATLIVRAGPEADPPGRAGLAAMTAALLTKGATRGDRAVSATAMAEAAEALGGSLDSASTWRGSSVGMTVTTPRLDAALGLMADALRRPTLAQAELDRARAQALDGLRYAMSSPDQVAGMVARRSYWGPTAYGAVTTPASLARLTREDVLNFHRSWYRPDLAILVLAGDVTPEAGLALATKHLGRWIAPRMAPPRLEPQPPAPLEAARVVIDMPGAGQSSVSVVAPYIALGAPERRVAQVAHAVLAGGYSARLNQEVRIKRGLSYGASASAEAQASGGMFVANAQTDNPNAGAVLQLLRDELLRLGREAPTREELAARQASLIGGFGRRMESTAGLAAQVAALLMQDRPLSELARYVDEVLAVTPEQVREFAQRQWPAAALQGVVVGDLKTAAEGLKGTAGLTVPLQKLDLEGRSLTRE